MKPTNRVDDELSTTLAREADKFSATHGADLTMDRVVLRAGEIRRGRRMRASIVMAAAVLAVAVPVGITAIGSHDPQRTRPAPLATPSTGVTQVDTSALNLGALGTGKVPQTGYEYGGKLYPANLDVTQDPQSPIEVARLNGGYLIREGNLEQSVRFVADDGSGPNVRWSLEGDFAVSAGGNVAAFVEPDGAVIAVQDAGSRYFEIGRIPLDTSAPAPTPSSFSAVAVIGENCSGRSEADTCRIYVNDLGQLQQPWVISPHAAARRLTGLHKISDVSSSGEIVGISSTSDSGSCSEAHGQDLTTLWTICQHQTKTFSPSGDLLLGSPAYSDGLGDNTMYVLSAANGTEKLALSVGPDAFISSTRWEDDEHILVTMYQSNRWAVLRIGLNGSREYALPPVAADDTHPPYVLPTAN